MPNTTDRFPQVAVNALPHLTTEQMIEVDRAMIEDYGIVLLQMMENAGRGLARLAATRFLGNSLRGKNVVALAGRGGNGGGALVAARRLHCWGANVSVLLTKPSGAFEGVPAHQLSIVQQLGIPVDDKSLPGREVDVILDGVIGYSLRGNPRGRAADLIRWSNQQPAPTLALDTPSGIDAASGGVSDTSILAAATFTLALPKSGLFSAAGSRHVGELYLGDISVPPSLYAAMGLTIPPSLFAESDIVRLV
ncbi:Bifunctional NAD(P)H-hydrate repair enzyme Nnr [Novipirellula galeiformis]|uniref:NAD(P)H-hydrate epimerase n=1 Tax=Novipirellula galeiformis TaxID=2528004 RepID=A0A5C6CLT0_9BACT|nr:NAD(P)H-hydrate epimerase [Novipirellula galeiformis]TWU25302.1 Bifunctional NAD(P)H-hydrate repair enzyme Nnr [Novipirellula galeiformis]